MAVAHVSALRQLRDEFNITREDIVRHAQISLGTIRNAELNNPVTMRTARQILKGMNCCLRGLQQPEIQSVEELGLNIRTADMEPLRIVKPIAS